AHPRHRRATPRIRATRDRLLRPCTAATERIPTTEKGAAMIDFTIQTEIARPVSAVFAHVTDPSKLASWQTSTISAIQQDDGPLGSGTRLRETPRAPRGKEFASRVEVSEYEPDRTFALRMIEGALPLDARITFEPIEQGTRVRFHAFGQP